MADSVTAKFYALRDGKSESDLINHLTEECAYREFLLRSEVQEANGVSVRCFLRTTQPVPDWVNLIKAYVLDNAILTGLESAKKYNFVGLLTPYEPGLRAQTTIITGGSGHRHVEEFIDYSFGIRVLEAVFDKDENLLETVSDKGMIGDVLASRRFYRRGRSLAYEDDFGKCFREIGSRLTKAQVESIFPSMSSAKPTQVNPTVGIAASSRVELKTRITLPAVLSMALDLARIASTPSPRIFNRSLTAIDPRYDRDLVKELDSRILQDFAKHALVPDSHTTDFDFCHRDFDVFFESTLCSITFEKLTSPTGGAPDQIIYEDLTRLSDLRLIRQMYERVRPTKEYQSANDKFDFLVGAFRDARVRTLDEDNQITTEGRFLDYLQRELAVDGRAYFRIDGQWYQIESNFDTALAERYASRITPSFERFEFLPSWVEGDEDSYNEMLGKQPMAFNLHRVTVSNVELCDGLSFDNDNEIVYVVHVKNGVGATIRDLTSQVFMSARILEEESKTKDKKSMCELYQRGRDRDRLEGLGLSKTAFAETLSRYRRCYVLVLRDKRLSNQVIVQGSYSSRIAKFSLVEFAGVMRANEWDFRIAVVGSEGPA